MKFYEQLLKENRKLLTDDEHLKAIFSDRVLESFPINKEIRRAELMHEWFENHFKRQGNDAPDYDVELTHGTVRFIKSVCVLYLQDLRRHREVIASRSSISKAVLEAVDQQLGRFEEKAEIGVLGVATPYPIALSQLPNINQEAPAVRKDPPPADHLRPRPIILDTIEIRNLDLRNRCLDLFAQFRDDGQHDRLDTVVREATSILGVELAKYAFADPLSNPRLIASDVHAEQEAGHLLYRGVFGFLRNSVHHKIVKDLQPERVLQIVGTVDYLFSVAEAARRKRRKP